MGEFGWAYISGSNAGGIGDSVQIKKNQDLTGSSNFTYNIDSSTVALTGTLNVSGTINANAFNLDVTSKNVTNLSVTGSSKFGDTADDVHQFTGSLKIAGAASSSLGNSALSYSGINATITNTISSAIVSGSTMITGAAGMFTSTVSGGAGTFTTLAGTALALQNGGITNAGQIAGATSGTFSSTVSGAAGTFTTLAGTSLSLQNGGIADVGSIAGGTTISGTVGNYTTLTGTSLNLQVGGITNAGAIAGATTVSGGAGSFVGIVGTSLNLQAGGISNAGAIAGATTISGSSDLKMGGDISGSTLNLTGLSSGTATTSSYLALDSNNNVILTSSSGGGVASDSKIGAAEDGDYTDGLYTDFTSNTLIGIPIDRFNEVLKILAPSPAPAVNSINEDVTDGITAKLSFGSSNTVTDYTSSGTAAGFTAVGRTGSYSATTSGSNIRLGVYDGTQDITGFINYDTVESVSNGYLAYSNDAFGNANEGTLKLELNGTVIHSVALSGLVGSGNPFSGSATSLTSQSGFTNVSVTASSFDGNNAEWYIFKHRTAKFKVDADNQKVGWNYARVIHSLSTDSTTNYIEWVNDPSGAVNDLSVSGQRIEEVALVGSKYLSGIKYNTDATAKYKAEINNLYRNVYAASGTPISFTVSNSAQPSAQSVPDIGVSEDNTKILGVTASLDFNGSTLFSGSITSNTTVTHPLKNTISNQGSATTGNGFLIDNRTLASTVLEEKFHDETYRKVSSSYNDQASTTNVVSYWNSQTHMTGSNVDGHQDGLLFHNQRLYSPVDADIPHGGNFAALTNVESGNPNYSGITGTRTFYRVVSNSSGVTKRDMKIVSTKNSTTYNDSTLGASNLHFFVKVPGATGWMDISQNFVYGSISDDNGALIAGASNDVDSGNNTHFITFGTESVANGENVMVKILADESWGGYLSELSFSVGATSNTATETAALDDIDANNTGTEARLSFGVSGSVAEYNNATGSSISLTDHNLNDSYTVSGDRRGVFSIKQNLVGTLNEDVNNNGKNHSANSFKNAYTGSLILEVNGLDVHTINLASSLNQISSSNGNTSGFIVSSASFSTTTDNIPDYTKPYRTGSYYVGPAEQNVGWNYARVKHTIGDSTTNTNYVEWVIDPSGSTDDTGLSSTVLSNLGHTSLYYQSGVRYFATNPTASFQFTGSNFYRNVYSSNASAVSFPTTTNCAITNIVISGSGLTTENVNTTSARLALLNSSSNCHLTDVHVTGTLQYDGATPSISGGLGLFTARDISVTGRIKHPFKSDKTTAASSKTALMIYSGAVGGTNSTTNEYFNTETYRIVSGNYANQTDTTSSTNTWNSQTHMNAVNAHGDGMATVNGYALSPFQIGNDGDTRNTSDGGSLQAPDGNPNYSTLTNATRSFYRYFQNTTGQAKPTFTVTLYGDANIISKSGAFYTGHLGENKNINVELKVPYDNSYTGDDDTSTAWGDVVKPYSAGVQPSTDGVGIYSGGGSGLDQTVDGSGAAIGIQLQEKQIRNNQYYVVKVTAHKDWTGYLSRILITY